MKSFAGQRVSVFGVGKSGMAAARLLKREGAQVTALDQRSRKELEPQAVELEALGVPLVCGSIPREMLETVDLLVVSPGVPLALTEIRGARAAGVRIWGEVELASRFVPPSVLKLGITGTNGKSTTTALTGELFSQAGLKTFVGGNLGRPWSEAALAETHFDAHVIELSSFQLESTEAMRLNAAAVLNLTPDHMDRYGSFKEYAAAKARIFLHQEKSDFVVVNADDASVVDLCRSVRVPVFAFSLLAKRTLASFAGGGWPEGNGFQLGLPGGSTAHFRMGNRALRGAHNLQNAIAAALLARLGGIELSAIQRGLDSFPGLPHRLEWVRTLHEVEWVNDSKATNVDSTVTALNAMQAPVWLIAGGRGKGAPYTPMVSAATGKVEGVLTIGEDARKIEQAFAGFRVHPCQTLDRAVAEAHRVAAPGSVVLLSPACASYDQFKNFEERGEAFKILVRAL